MFVVESNTSSTEPPLLANWAEEKEGGGGSDEDATTVIEFPLVYDTLYSLEAFPDKITLKVIVPGRFCALKERKEERTDEGRNESILGYTLPTAV